MPTPRSAQRAPTPQRPSAPRARPEPASARLGRWGEDLAVRYLRDLGLEVLERNWRCEFGEVDIVARDGDCLVICEVKTRRTAAFGEPVEAVRWDKALRLRRLSTAYLAAQRPGTDQVRIDVVGLLAKPGQPVQIRHIVGVGS
ncbi:MAG: YraN family protein [Ornithinibacter sp.]